MALPRPWGRGSGSPLVLLGSPAPAPPQTLLLSALGRGRHGEPRGEARCPPASPARVSPGCRARPRAPRAGRRGAAGARPGLGLGGRTVDPAPRHLDAARGPFEVVQGARGASLFARPLWLGAWRWFTAAMPLNLFPGDPGSIRPGPSGAVRRAEIKGGPGPFIGVGLRLGRRAGLPERNAGAARRPRRPADPADPADPQTRTPRTPAHPADPQTPRGWREEPAARRRGCGTELMVPRLFPSRPAGSAIL